MLDFHGCHPKYGLIIGWKQEPSWLLKPGQASCHEGLLSLHSGGLQVPVCKVGSRSWCSFQRIVTVTLALILKWAAVSHATNGTIQLSCNPMAVPNPHWHRPAYNFSNSTVNRPLVEMGHLPWTPLIKVFELKALTIWFWKKRQPDITCSSHLIKKVIIRKMSMSCLANWNPI